MIDSGRGGGEDIRESAGDFSVGHAVTPPLRIEVAGQTDVGRKRSHNEDNFAIMADLGLYMVADGMGGHASGEVAAKMAIDTLQEFFTATADDPERTWPYKMDRSKGYEENRLITGIKLCNLRIYEQARGNPKQRGMGTTVVVLFAVEEGVYVGHVGDENIHGASGEFGGRVWSISRLSDKRTRR